MITDDALKEWKSELQAEVIDDEEEVCMEAIEALPGLIDEVLLYRRTLLKLARNPYLDPEANAEFASLSLEAVKHNIISERMKAFTD